MEWLIGVAMLTGFARRNAACQQPGVAFELRRRPAGQSIACKSCVVGRGHRWTLAAAALPNPTI
jgi:hypothetical protein